MAKNLFTLTVKTTTPADSELLVGGTGSANAYNFTWTKLREWVGDIASFIFTGSLEIGGNTTINAQLLTMNYEGSGAGLVINRIGSSASSLSIKNTGGEVIHDYNGVGYSFHISSSEVVSMTTAGLNVIGALSKGSGSFKIDHPLKPDTHYLVHSFTESPKADLIYRDIVKLVNGKAEVNIDLVSDMTDGTFDVLCGNVQCFTSNETGWDLVKGSVKGNVLTIQSKTLSSTDTISWMVIGERKDKHMIETSWTDKDGHVIVEPLKEVKKDVK